MEEWSEIRQLHAQGLSVRAIAKRLEIHRDTVAKYLRADRKPRYPTRVSPQPGVLDPFKGYLENRLLCFPELNATRLYREVRARGYAGSYVTLRRFVNPLKGVQKVQAVYRFESPPGLQSQVDWALFGHLEVDGRRHQLVAFILTLAYSRAKYVEFTTDMSTPTWLRCHQHAFEYLGGHTKEFLYDNTKNVVLRRAYLTADSQLNPMYLDFAGYYGITPRLCKPYRPETKGKVENSVRHVREDFYLGTPFSSLQELNHRVLQWCNESNQRPHRTTRVPPIERLIEEHLTPVDGRAPYPVQQTLERRISRDCYVDLWGSRYSVPWRFAGRTARIHLKGEGFTVEVAGQEICHHALAVGAHRVVRVAAHFEGLLAAIRRQNQVQQLRLDSFQSLPSAPVVEQRDLAVYDTLMEDAK